MTRLSIYVPTFKRPDLHDCLASIPLHPDVDIHVSDNSPDGYAKDIVAQFPHVNYSCRNFNILGDANCFRGLTVGEGTYVWVVGDDDRLLPDAIPNVLHLLDEDPDRLVVLTEKAAVRIGVTESHIGFPQEMISWVNDPSLWVATTLITANVWKRSSMNLGLGLNKLDTCYPIPWAGVHATQIAVLATPVFIAGTGHALGIPWIEQSWQDYLNEFYDHAGLARVTAGESAVWNFPYLERRS